jgi:hypothetical protein
MKRYLLPVLACVSVLASSAIAQASDRSLERAVGAYKGSLTSDIGYLASFSAPSSRGAAAAQARVGRILRDLAAAGSAARSQRASSSSVRRGQSLILSALHYATLAADDARSSAGAARSGNGAAARGEARAEQSQINRAIPLFESGGHLLHLF